MSEKVRRSARLNMRLTPQEFHAIREAARVEGVDVTTFVLSAALERCQAVTVGERRATAGAQ